jgi:23S rRNA (guanine2445-N2)-methyltransferase / 23S rRNA (guanine2069-N7)-methyltransferase
MLYWSGWDELLRTHTHQDPVQLVDPMCGSGTIIIEAALMAHQMAPGLMRRRHGFKNLKIHDAQAWDELVKEAETKVIRDASRLPRIIGYDQDPKAVHAAIENVESAHLRSTIHVEKRELEKIDCSSHPQRGLFILNPPYGDRLGEEEALIPLYRLIGDQMKKTFQGLEGGSADRFSGAQ